jgi:3-oxoacyl-[acyl-carrier-protein] synthase-3
MKAYITSIGKFLPGSPIDNEHIEDILGKIKGHPSRNKARVLKRNGILQRYYAIDEQQATRFSNSQMAALAIQDALEAANFESASLDLLTAATTLPDLQVPGFACMVHGHLAGAPPLEVASIQGVCCSGVVALRYAASQIQLGYRKMAATVASEFASRIFKHTRFEVQNSVKSGRSVDFDVEFLRWMLSDGAGAVIVQPEPKDKGLSLEIQMIELISHANTHPVCMYAGTTDPESNRSWLDYASVVEASMDGATDLRQNIRLLDQMIQLASEDFASFVGKSMINPDEVDWFLCHYSSDYFRQPAMEAYKKKGCLIPEEKWFTNLCWRGNTGSASIFLMLEELYYSGKLQPGQKILCYIPESGRFTNGFMLLQAVGCLDPDLRPRDKVVLEATPTITKPAPMIQSVPPQPAPAKLSPLSFMGKGASQDLLLGLADIWEDHEQALQGIPLIVKLNDGTFTLEDYKAWLRNLRPQVADGARWITRAASNMMDFELRSLIIGHALEEHRDFQILDRNYVSVGGELSEITQAEKNVGGEALSAFIFQRASQENPVDLFGSMFIIEGMGNRLAGKWSSRIQEILGLTPEQVSFFGYHSANDDRHLDKLQNLLGSEWITPDTVQRILKTAQVTARLYRLQLEYVQ